MTERKSRKKPEAVAAAPIVETKEPRPRDPHELYRSLRNNIELYYDYQRARIAYDHRSEDPNETENLSPEDKAFMEKLGRDSEVLEKSILKHAAGKLKDHPIYQWLVSQRGIADTFAVILLGMINIHKTETASGLWRLAGLAVINGKSERPVRGQKLVYSPHLKTRMYLLGESFIKARNEQYRPYYDDYKARKQREIVTCMLCNGTGVFTKKADADADENEAAETPTSGKVCPRCKGEKRAPWGRSDKHLHIASMRYMVKQFLIQLYTRWRTYEGLPVRVPYAEEYHERMKLQKGA